MWSTPTSKKRETGSPTDYSEVWSFSHQPRGGLPGHPALKSNRTCLWVPQDCSKQRRSCSWVWKHALELGPQGSVQRQQAKAPSTQSFLEGILLEVVHPLSKSMASNLHASGCWVLPSPFRRYSCNANQSYIILYQQTEG